MLDNMTMDELIAAYNATPKPNIYGRELQLRINAMDREDFGMNAENPRLRQHGWPPTALLEHHGSTPWQGTQARHNESAHRR